MFVQVMQGMQAMILLVYLFLALPFALLSFCHFFVSTCIHDLHSLHHLHLA
jgi:hypothetical protein